MVVVQLKVSDGNTYPVRCKQIQPNPILETHIVLVDCLDPVPTQFGELVNAHWCVDKADIANYVVGKKLKDEEDLSDDVTEEVPKLSL